MKDFADVYTYDGWMVRV